MTRVLYWDIDGTIIDQSIDEAVKPALAGGVFQSWIEAAGFDHTICVSGRATMARDALFRPYEIAAGMSPEQEEVCMRSVWETVYDAFPSFEAFAQLTRLRYENDDRGQAIDLTEDWYYLDDLADHFFIKAYGERVFEEELGRRILMCDPEGDGSDIIAWLRSIAESPRDGDRAPNP